MAQPSFMKSSILFTVLCITFLASTESLDKCKAWVCIVNKGGRKIQPSGIKILPDGEVVIKASKFSAAHMVEPAASFEV